jgi:hypothetical protein
MVDSKETQESSSLISQNLIMDELTVEDIQWVRDVARELAKNNKNFLDMD